MNTRKGKQYSQPAGRSVAPVRGKDRDQRKTDHSSSPAQPPAPALATTTTGAKTLESAIEKITGLRIQQEHNYTTEEEDQLLETNEDAPIQMETNNQEKKSLLAWRQAYKKIKCNLNRVSSHQEFIEACMVNRKVPRGLQVKVQCNALLADLSDVRSKFQHTRLQRKTSQKH